MVWRGGATESQHLVTSVEVGAGEILFCGTYLGDAYFARGANEGFETFVMDLVKSAGIALPVRVVAPQAHSTTFTHVRVGRSGDHTLVFVFASSPEERVELAFPAGRLGNDVVDLLSDREISVIGGDEGEARVVLGPTDWGISVLKG
jgi:hypothetical protein